VKLKNKEQLSINNFMEKLNCLMCIKTSKGYTELLPAYKSKPLGKCQATAAHEKKFNMATKQTLAPPQKFTA
jgi:hypothetical protein